MGMIEVENLTKVYGSTRSLDGLSFSVGEGQVLGLLGPNGAGKTTTMRILTGLARPTDGRARVAGYETTRHHEAIRRMLGYLPEESPLYGEMRADDYLRFMAGMKLIPRRQIRSEVDRVLGEVGLSPARKRLVGNMSKGMRQRLGLAQALLGNPRVMILDEPTVGLDPSQINDVRDLIADMRGKRTVILSTHILSNVELTCTHVVIINNGRLVAQGPVNEVGGPSGCGRITVRAAATVARVKGLLEKLGTVTSARQEGDVAVIELTPAAGEDTRPRIARAVVEAGIDLLELHEARPTLEDVFLAAIAREEVAMRGDA